MTPEEAAKLKKVVKAPRPVRKIKLPVGGKVTASDDGAYAKKLALQLSDEAKKTREKYPDVCEKCGAPSGPTGCSIAVLTQPLAGLFVSDPDGNRLEFANQCDELAEFLRMKSQGAAKP